MYKLPFNLKIKNTNKNKNLNSKFLSVLKNSQSPLRELFFRETSLFEIVLQPLSPPRIRNRWKKEWIRDWNGFIGASWLGEGGGVAKFHHNTNKGGGGGQQIFVMTSIITNEHKCKR